MIESLKIRAAGLRLAPRDSDGMVRFSGDVVLLRPDEGRTAPVPPFRS